MDSAYLELIQWFKKFDSSNRILDYEYGYGWSWRTGSRRHSIKVVWVATEYEELMGDNDMYTYCEEDTLEELLLSVRTDIRL